MRNYQDKGGLRFRSTAQKNLHTGLANTFSLELRLPEEKRTVCRFPNCDRPVLDPENTREVEVCQVHRDHMDATGTLEERSWSSPSSSHEWSRLRPLGLAS